MVIASDGLFDNLFDEEIADIVNALVRVRFASTVSSLRAFYLVAARHVAFNAA